MITIPEEHNAVRLQATMDFIDLGPANARLRLYADTRPMNGGMGTLLLGDVELAKPCGSISAGQLFLTPTGPASITATGEITWARIVNGNGDIAADLDVSSAAVGTGDIQVPDTNVLIGGATELAYGVIT